MINTKHFYYYLGGLLVLWKIWALVLMIVARAVLPLNQTFSLANDEFLGRHLPYLVSDWANFDGIHYILVGQEGYRVGEHPFFPLYPVTMAILRMITGLDWIVSGILISHLAFGAALYWIHKLLKADIKDISQTGQLWFFIFLLAFPTSFFYGAVYNDALFLLFSAGCLWFGRHRRWWLAGLAGALATLTRLNGVALLVYLAAEYVWGDCSLKQSWQLHQWLQQIKQKLSLYSIWQSRIWSTGLIPLALLGYLLYIQLTAGSWQLLFTAMDVWEQSHVTFPLQVVWRYLKILMTVPFSLIYAVALLEFSSVVFYCGLLGLLLKRIRLSYWLFMAASILIPWLTGTFQGMPRYALHLYPLFLGGWLLLKKRPTWQKISWVGVGLLLQAFVMILFSRGYFVT